MTRARLIVLIVGGLVAVLLVAIERKGDVVPEVIVDAKIARTRPVIVRRGGTSMSERVALGVRFEFIVEDADEARAEQALSAVWARLDELDGQLRAWKPSSALWTINARAGHGSTSISRDAYTLLTRARALHEQTGGLYDPTIGAVSTLWAFDDPSQPLPNRAALEHALVLVDGSRLELDFNTASLPEAGMRLDLSGLEATYALSEAMDVLVRAGVDGAMIRAGDDVLTHGAVRGPHRVVTIKNPRWPDQAAEHFNAPEGAVAMVSDAHRALVRDGRVLAPVLDPRTGEPARDCHSVTIITDDPLEARAFALAVFVLGPVEGLAWAEDKPRVEASIFDSQGRARRTSGWTKVALELPPLPTKGTPRGLSAPPQPRERTTPETPPPSRARPTRGRDMVKIEGGSFLEGREREPAHVDGFAIDRHEVSNAEYARFLDELAELGDEHSHCHPAEPEGYDHVPRYFHAFSPRLVRNGIAGSLAPFESETFRAPEGPVVGVSFWDAYAFARWSGKRLPTRREWGRTCGGPKGWTWPFGDQWIRDAANTGGERNGERDGHTYAAPVTSFSAGASFEGCLHMAGNVSEWTAEGWAMGGSSRSNPSGVACWAGVLREPSFRAFDLGFRTAVDLDR